MTNISTGAFTASLLGTYIVSKVRIEYFLIAMLSIGATGVGAAIAPWFSSTVVEATGAVGDALRACLAIQGVVLISVVLLTIFGRKWQGSTEAARN